MGSTPTVSTNFYVGFQNVTGVIRFDGTEVQGAEHVAVAWSNPQADTNLKGNKMAAPIVYIPEFFHKVTVDEFDAAIAWEQREAPRAEAYYALDNIPYSYGRGAGVRTYHPNVITPQTSELILQVWFNVSTLLGKTFELLFCNRYADQHQHLGWHADDGEIVDPARPIVVVSFGAEREIWIRKNGEELVEKFTLGHGSILVMNAGMQQTHQHRIPKHDRPCGTRISLTFRGFAEPMAV